MPLTDEQLERYARHLVLKEIGGPGQAKLLGARVLIIGAGGLGSPLALYLAAAGVGTIGLVDPDEVSLSNLQRQVLFRTSDIGKPKPRAAEAHLRALNPDIKIETHLVRLTPDNAVDLVGSYDLVADGCDNFETRFAVNAATIETKTTLVSGAVGRFDGQIATFKPHAMDADGAPFPCYRCLVSDPPEAGLVPTCAQAGIVGALTGIVGSLQALEVIKELTGQGALAGQLLLFDGLSMEMRKITLAHDPACPACGGV